MSNFTIRTGRSDHVSLLPIPLENNAVFKDLMVAWDLLNHTFVTGPRRRIQNKRNLNLIKVGDFLVIEKDKERFATARVEQIRYGDRGLPELVIDEKRDNNLINEDLIDEVFVFYDTLNAQTGETERRRAIFNMETRIERKDLISYVQTVGFNFLSDDLSTEAYWRIAQNVGRYRKESSTYESVKFLSWMINANFEVEALWTADGVTFDRRNVISRQRNNNETEITVGSTTYFPTSRMLLKYDAEINPFINLNKMQELFLQQAPINVVLDRILAVIEPFNSEVKTLTGSFTRSRYIAEARSS